MRFRGVLVRWAWPLIIVLSALAAGLAVYSGQVNPVRQFFVVWFLLVCPGMAFIRLLRMADNFFQFFLAVALSIALDTFVALGMVYTHFWHPIWGLAFLIGLSMVGVALQIYQQTRLAKPSLP